MEQLNNDDKSICGTWQLTGNAAQIVLDKIEEKKKDGVGTFGKERAIQLLLCEFYKIKKGV